MTGKAARRFSREFKLAALRRMQGGENVSALADELGIRRKYLYAWLERYRNGGAVGLRSCGRPTKEEALAMSAQAGLPPDPEGVLLPPTGADRDSLIKAERRIAELERKIGRQQVELDFFQRALRQVRDVHQRSGTPGATASTRSSKR
jgi:transposase